ncbi:hypothetical protein ASO20_00415 [Mycoplasma sp. (ex Biomphalaria glabrata)]|uniref:hypothetical protein n=1 Tax=Mycoplasma sp. (ex Biomphalaria glabrata) TaxID=1749074 RepID=UPI00073A7736|nr:hypothetical protein [Mycoplasma sp. (ex Biomphalaria glabrata)]ALV23145.1 hypothetical protein ASO20_00415 [Mycoplasma sp. (ex Biomphalaria glabrata)]
MTNLEFLVATSNDTQKAIVVFVGVMVFFILVGTFVLAHRLSSKSAKKNNLLNSRKEMESWISNYDYNTERPKNFSDDNLLLYLNAQLTELAKHKEHNTKLIDEQEKILKAKISLIEKKINQPKQTPFVSQTPKPSLFNRKKIDKQELEPAPEEVVRTEQFQHNINQPPLAYANNLNQQSYNVKKEEPNDDVYAKYAEESLFSNTAKKVLSLDSTNEINDDEDKDSVSTYNPLSEKSFTENKSESKDELDALIDEFEKTDEIILDVEDKDDDFTDDDNEEELELEKPFRPSSVIDFKLDELETKISDDSNDDYDSNDDFDWLDENNEQNDQEETLDEEDLM